MLLPFAATDGRADFKQPVSSQPVCEVRMDVDSPLVHGGLWYTSIRRSVFLSECRQCRHWKGVYAPMHSSGRDDAQADDRSGLNSDRSR